MATPGVMISGFFQLKAVKRKLRDKLSEKEQAWPVFTLKEYAKMVLDSTDRRGRSVPSQTLSPAYKRQTFMKLQALFEKHGSIPIWDVHLQPQQADLQEASFLILWSTESNTP
ncbi:hypothetical protein BGZ46_007433 [Entomortierella lignicola]|nr:hypothetical protein BGZ46_007433 [Entomortierella lignicola]